MDIKSIELTINYKNGKTRCVSFDAPDKDKGQTEDAYKHGIERIKGLAVKFIAGKEW